MSRDIRKIFLRSTPPPQKLSLLVPIFNEAHNLAQVIRILDEVPWPLKVECVFVDDGSTDGSESVIRKARPKNLEVRFFRFEKNQGKGAAIQKGIEEANGEIIAVQDADQEYDPNDLLTLIQPFLEGKADVVYGSRFRRDVRQVHRTFHRSINVLLTLLSNMASGIYLSDMETCYKVFRADVLKSFHLRTKRFGFEPEVTAYLAKFSLRVLEFPISYFPRNYLEGKKIGWKDGVAALWFIFKFNFLTSPESCLKNEAVVVPAARDAKKDAA